MSIGVLVDGTWPFGDTKAEGARKGATKRAIMLAIQRHVLDSGGGAEAPKSRDKNTDTLVTLDGAPLEEPEPYGEARRAFAEQWKTFRARQPETNAILVSMAEDGESANRSFTLGFYGLCWCLASTDFDVLSGAGDEDDDTTIAEDGDAEPAGPSPGALWADRSHVVSSIADLLLRLLPEPHHGDAAESARAPKACVRPERDHARLVADAILSCLLAAMPGSFELGTAYIESTSRGPVTRQPILAKPQLLRRIERMLKELPFRFTVQPRDTPPSYGDADPAANETKIHIPLIGYRRSNRFLARFLGEALKGRDSAFDYSAYLRAVDMQQRVGWRINVPLLRQAEMLKCLAAESKELGDEARAAIQRAGLDAAATDELRSWVSEKFYVPEPGERKRYALPGEFLDSPLARQAFADLAPAGGEAKTFYLPWKADYRGRIYAETPWLTPQGGDLQRALFEFACGRPLDTTGICALKRHGAALMGSARVASDLKIEPRRVPTLEERERWVEVQENEICASAAEPLGSGFWRHAKKPLQFLAFCFAYRQWKEYPQRPTHLPVQIDGTCNGLQHIAAMVGDQNLARAVNVLAGDETLPRDIYSELAEAARGMFGQIDSHDLGKLPSSLATIVKKADTLLRDGAFENIELDRDLAKAVVMTVPYGAGVLAQTQGVAQRLERRTRAFEPGSELWEMVSRWGRELGGDIKALKTALSWAKGSFRPTPWRSAESRETEQEKRRIKRIVTGVIAFVMVHHLRMALYCQYPSIEGFKKALGAIAKPCDGLPLMWLSPLGLPVCQDKFRPDRSTLSARLACNGKVEKIDIGVSILTEQVSEKGQVQALLPNLIHCFDAAHLAMMLNAAAAQNITEVGTIHDCLLCHPNDAARLAAIARATFCELYRPGADGDTPAAVEGWYSWMDFVAHVAAIEQPTLLKGALVEPGGNGEQWLQSESTRGGEREAAAKKALTLLAEIRTFAPPRGALARLIVDYAASVPVKAKARGVPDQKRPTRRWHATPIDFARTLPECETVVMKPQRMAPLTLDRMSEYFFS